MASETLVYVKNTSQAQHINGLPTGLEERLDRVHQMYSKVPCYNNNYELDFRNKRKSGLKIKSSVKKIWIKLYKLSKYMMDYRSPLTGYQDFYASTDKCIHQMFIIIWNNMMSRYQSRLDLKGTTISLPLFIIFVCVWLYN